MSIGVFSFFIETTLLFVQISICIESNVFLMMRRAGLAQEMPSLFYKVILPEVFVPSLLSDIARGVS